MRLSTQNTIDELRLTTAKPLNYRQLITPEALDGLGFAVMNVNNLASLNLMLPYMLALQTLYPNLDLRYTNIISLFRPVVLELLDARPLTSETTNSYAYIRLITDDGSLRLHIDADTIIRKIESWSRLERATDLLHDLFAFKVVSPKSQLDSMIPSRVAETIQAHLVETCSQDDPQLVDYLALFQAQVTLPDMVNEISQQIDLESYLLDHIEQQAANAKWLSCLGLILNIVYRSNSQNRIDDDHTLFIADQPLSPQTNQDLVPPLLFQP